MTNGRWIGILFLVAIGCGARMADPQYAEPASGDLAVSYEDSLKALFISNIPYLSEGFDYPVGKPDARHYYNAQAFGTNNHLGDDWNGRDGGNTDLGDPVYSISNGVVTQSVNFFGGWGKVVRIAHAWKENDEMKMVESLYAHMDTMLVKKGQWLRKGDVIGKIGTAEGHYLAHLHLEIRDCAGMELGGGYSKNTIGFLDPTAFIKGHRSIATN